MKTIKAHEKYIEYIKSQKWSLSCISDKIIAMQMNGPSVWKKKTVGKYNKMLTLIVHGRTWS